MDIKIINSDSPVRTWYIYDNGTEIVKSKVSG